MIDPIEVKIEYGSAVAVGTVVRLHPTGLMVELKSLPYRVGVAVRLSFRVPRRGEFQIMAKAVRSYDNHKKKIQVQTEDGPKVEVVQLRLSELHFMSPPEELRSAVSAYLVEARVQAMKKVK